jgi:hypothetical protein
MTQIGLDFEADIARDVERLTTLAGELALKAGRHGVTVSDLRLAAVRAEILTGGESASRMKQLNLGAVMKAAGLFASGMYRRSDVGRSHGNLHSVWTTIEFAEEANARRIS